MKFGIVSGEVSGDILGAGLIRELKKIYPTAKFIGIGGERMIAEGFDSLFPQDRLAVMGIVEPLKRLPELLSIRKQLYNTFSNENFDCFIGIDSPDFNFTLEKKLKAKGLAVAHYVSPSVWAWRQGRIKKIAKAIDLMLTLLPFENKIYDDNNIPAVFVGHPLADKFVLKPDLKQAKSILYEIVGKNYNATQPLLACLPGSRSGEIALLGEIFWQALLQCQQAMPNLQVIVPAANTLRRQQIEMQLSQYPTLNLIVIDGHSHEVMAAADTVLLASGTTALEAMLLKKPMVVSYKLKTLSYWIIKALIKVPYVSLPNLLSNKMLVPELLQADATPDNIAQQTLKQLSDSHNRESLVQSFLTIHQTLKADADKTAAQAIAQLLKKANHQC